MFLQVETALDLADTRADEVTLLGLAFVIIFILILDRIRLLKTIKELRGELSEVNKLRLSDIKDVLAEYADLIIKNNTTLERLVTEWRITNERNDRQR